MSAPIEIVFAIPALDHGGPDRVLFEILRAIDRTRFAPRLMVSEPTGYYLSRLPSDIPVEVLGSERSRLDRYPVYRALRVIRRIAPDVVFATLRMIQTLGLAAPLFPCRTKLILRQATHASTDWDALIASSRIKHRVARRLTIRSLRQADAVVCQSEVMKADLRALLGDDRTLHVVGNPIDVAAVTHASALAQPIRGNPALISVGRFQQMKGYDILLRSLPAVVRRHPELHLTILGDGPDRASLEQLARELGIAHAVTFAGFDPEPLPKVRAADLFVLASRYEGFPNAALEALACGTPVVLTNCPGANEQLVKPGINGRLARDISPDGFAVALAEAIAERDHYDRPGITADCTQRYGARQIVAAYERVFASVVEVPSSIEGRPL